MAQQENSTASEEKWVKPLDLTFNEPTAPRIGPAGDIFKRRAIRVGPKFDVLKAIGRR